LAGDVSISKLGTIRNGMEIVRVVMEIVIGQVILYPQNYQQAASHSDSQTTHIEECKPFVSNYTAKRYFEIVPEHSLSFQPDYRIQPPSRAGFLLPHDRQTDESLSVHSLHTSASASPLQ